MALTDFDEYISKLRENRTADFQMGAATSRNGRLAALWPAFLPAPALPTTSVALDKDSAQSLGPIPSSTGSLSMLGARLNSSGLSGIGVILMDLLNVSGGLNGTLTTAQTTNLPTAALTRYTNGEGVMAGIIIHATVGSTGTTVTISYTNQAGTPGRTSVATTFGGTGFREAGALITIPLAAGDTGVRSVESVTVAATTASAGNFGVCLFKPLAMLSMENTTGVSVLDAISTGGVIGSLCEINSNACLTAAAYASVNQLISGAVIIAEV